MGQSDYYRVLQPMSKGRIIPGLFHTQDEHLHRSMKRPIAGIYSMTNVASFEPYVDTTIEFLFKRLEEVIRTEPASKGHVDLGVWLQWFAFDVMGEITFSKRLGFLEQAHDIEGIMANIWKSFKYASWVRRHTPFLVANFGFGKRNLRLANQYKQVGQMPWLDKLWVKNPFISRMRPEKSNPVVAFALARAQERNQHGEDSKLLSSSSPSRSNSQDFMSRFLEARAKDPDNIPEWYVTAWATSNILAGSDTTAIVMRSVIYYLLRDARSLQLLRAEMAYARDAGQLSDIATWKESRRLMFLAACIKEAERLHPPIGLPLERVVPPGGANLCGKYFRAGTVVGMNPWVVHRNKEVFGDDADEWNPERWLNADDERRALMERSLLTVSKCAPFPFSITLTCATMISSGPAIERVSARISAISRSIS